MNLRKNLEIHPNPIVEVGSPVSRVEMNAKGAPLTPACPHRRLSTRFSRPRAVKIALTKPTQSYMTKPTQSYMTKPTQSYTANLIKPLFRGAAHGRMEEKVGLLFFSWFSYFRLRY
jgi:hypothetical protein